MLRRMLADKLIKIQEYDLQVPDFFMLPSTPKLKGYDKSKHERGAGNLFVSFYPYLKAFSESGEYAGWSFEPAVGNMRADRAFRLGDFTYYIEVDRCTEGLRVIKEKLDNYLSYQNTTKERFRVIFSLLSDTDRKIANRGESLIDLFSDYGKGNLFVAGNHNSFVNNPLGDVLYSPKDGAISIKDL